MCNRVSASPPSPKFQSRRALSGDTLLAVSIELNVTKSAKFDSYSSPCFRRFFTFSRSSMDCISCRRIGPNRSCCSGVSRRLPFRLPVPNPLVESEPHRVRVVSRIMGLSSPSSPSRSLSLPPDHVGSRPRALAEDARWLIGRGRRSSRDLLCLCR